MHAILPQEKNPALRSISKEIPRADIKRAQIQKLIADMKALLSKEEFGVALAAAQVGESVRLFIVSGRALARGARSAKDEPESSLKTKNEELKIGDKLERLLHRTIKKVTEDIEELKFNTAISALMILVNEIEKSPSLEIGNWKLVIKLLFPFAPHVAQDLWSQLGNETLLDHEDWPKHDEKLIIEEEFELLIQVNGKLRDKVMVSKNTTQEEAEKLVLGMEKIKEFVGKAKPKKIIFVAGRLINIVV